MSDPVLYLDGVSVVFDGFRALNNLSLIVDAGELRAIIGPNGAGKTTMMDVITGKTRPDEGYAVFEGGADLTKLDETEIARRGIGRKFQKPTVFEMHTVEDNLLLALSMDKSARASIRWRANADDANRIEKILDTIRLKPARWRLAGSPTGRRWSTPARSSSRRSLRAARRSFPSPTSEGV